MTHTAYLDGLLNGIAQTWTIRARQTSAIIDAFTVGPQVETGMQLIQDGWEGTEEELIIAVQELTK